MADRIIIGNVTATPAPVPGASTYLVNAVFGVCGDYVELQYISNLNGRKLQVNDLLVDTSGNLAVVTEVTPEYAEFELKVQAPTGGSGEGEGSGGSGGVVLPDNIAGDLEDIKDRLTNAEEVAEEAKNLANSTKTELEEDIQDVLDSIESTRAEIQAAKDELNTTKDEIQASITQTKEEIDATVDTFQEDIEAAEKSIEEATTKVESLVEDMDKIVSWKSRDGLKSGVAGFVSRADENDVTLAELAIWKDTTSEALTSISQTVESNKADITQVTKVQTENSEAITSIQQTATDKYAQIDIIANKANDNAEAISGLQTTIDENNTAVLAAIAKVETDYTNAVGGLRTEVSENYVANETLASFKDEAVAEATAGAREYADSTFATLEQFASWSDPNNPDSAALAALNLRVAENKAAIESLASIGESFAEFKSTVENDYAKTESITGVEDALASFKEEVSNDFASQTQTVTNLSDSFASYQLTATDTFASKEELTSYKDATLTALKAYADENYATQEMINEAKAEASTALTNFKTEAGNTYAKTSELNAFKTEVDGEITEAIAKSEATATEKFASKSDFTTFQTNTNTAITGIQQTANADRATLNTVVSWKSTAEESLESIVAFKEEANSKFAQATQVAQMINEKGEEITASITTKVEDEISSITLDADKINFGENVTVSNTDPNVFNVNNNFIVDRSGNLKLNGSIIWGTENSPTRAVYCATAATKPADGTTDFPAEHATSWHTTFKSGSDYYGSYTYDGGQTWGDPIQIVGKDGSDGKDGADGKDGTNGIDGKDGAQGPQGPAGADGKDGADGQDGAQGPKGDTGAKGDPGARGDSVQTVYLYYLKNNSTAPSKPSYTGGTVPSGWSLTPPSTSASNQYIFISQCTVTNDNYGTWSNPTCWAVFGKDGSDATVTATNVFNALTADGTLFGCFAGEDLDGDGKNDSLYINATYIKSGIVASDLVLTGEVTAGNIIAEGGKIGGWELTENTLVKEPGSYTYSNATYQYGGFGLRTAHSGIRVDQDPLLAIGWGENVGNGKYWADAPFCVFADGRIKATSGEIGGFTLRNNVLYYNGKDEIDKVFDGGDGGIYIGPDGISVGGGEAEDGSGSVYYPSVILEATTGKLIANNAEISGKITASEGKIANFVISDNALYNKYSFKSGGMDFEYYMTAPDTINYTYYMRDSTSEFSYVGADGIGTMKFTSLDGGNNSNYKVAQSYMSAGRLFSNSGVIAGWTISDNRLYSMPDTDSSEMFLNSAGATTLINGTSRDNVALKVGKNFGVTRTGTMYAASADITGKITASEGKIGGFIIKSSYITSSENKTTYSDTDTGVFIGTSGIGLGAGKFYVNSSGYLKSISGNIGGFNLADKKIYYGTIGSSKGIHLSIDDMEATINDTELTNLRFAIADKFGVTAEGNLYAKDAHLSNANISGVFSNVGTGFGIKIEESRIHFMNSTTDLGYLQGTTGLIPWDNTSGTVSGISCSCLFAANGGIRVGGKLMLSTGNGVYVSNKLALTMGQIKVQTNTGTTRYLLFYNGLLVGISGSSYSGVTDYSAKTY